MANSMPRIKKVPITIIEDGKEKIENIVVQKAGLGRWKQLTDVLNKIGSLLPEVANEQGHDSVDDFLDAVDVGMIAQLIPQVYGIAIDEIIEVLELGTEADQDFIVKHVGVDEAMELFQAIIEVNRLEKAVEMGKNLPFLRNLIRPGPQDLMQSMMKKSSTDSSGNSKKKQE